MNAVDLHVHSNKSDGSFTPSELVDMAIAKGLTAFALTDHDTTAGVKEAVAYGQEKGIEVIPGIEFSTEYYGKDIHIVGLFIDEDAPAFQEQIGSFVRAREERNEKMCARLAADAAERNIGHARHRRERELRFNFYRSDLHSPPLFDNNTSIV